MAALPQPPAAPVPQDLLARIARCQSCSGAPIVRDWIPISYFGDYFSCNAWVLTINPSDQEFLDRSGRVLTGPRQRFRRLSDFSGIRERAELTGRNIRTALEFQETYFEREGIPYRPFFNRLGRFISRLHGAASTGDALEPFKVGVRSGAGVVFRYAHLDIVKCATARPWSVLSVDERSLLLRNCSPYLEQQLRSHAGLELLLLNGRTAFAQCRAFLEGRLACEPDRQTLDLGGTSAEVWSGRMHVDGNVIRVLGWSPNVVNGRITASALDKLVDGIRAFCPDALTRGT